MREVEGEWLEVRDIAGWKTLVGDPDSAKKFLDWDWIKSLAKEIADYDKLIEIGMEVKIVQGFKVEISKGAERGKDYFQARMIDRGVTFRIYDDNVVILSYIGLGEKQRLEEFKVLKVDMTKILMRGCLKKNKFFDKFKPSCEVQLFKMVRIVKERGDEYAIIEFRANMEKGAVVS